MVFVWRDDTSGGTPPPAAIANINITMTYPKPTNLTANNVDAHSAVLTWTESGNASQWMLQYATDDTFTTNLVEISSGFNVNGSNISNSVTGLNSGTNYFARVKSVVGNNGSEWSDAIIFQTECAELSLPYSYDFENNIQDLSYPMPNCWNRTSVTNQRITYPYVHESAPSDYYQYAHGEGSNSTSGHYLHFYKTTSTSSETAILPAVDASYDMTQLQIRFWARLYSETYAGKTLDIGIMTSPSASGSFQTISTITVGGDESNAHTNYEEFVVPFSEYTGDGRYIAIRAGSTMGSNVVQILVDDITVEEIPNSTTIQTVQLAQDWNWFAPTADITLEQLEQALGTNGISINSQNQFARYDEEDEEWSGDLMALVPGQMYKIQVGADCNFTLTGTSLALVTVSIEYGDNWFGHIGSETMTVEEALNGFTPAEGDKTSSEDGSFTIYEDGEWGGNLLNLEPGRGYIYISQDTATKHITFTRNN